MLTIFDINARIELDRSLSNAGDLDKDIEKRKSGKWENMEEKNINLSEAINYLVQLFYATGQKYSCTRPKLGKLLSIVAFRYARRGEKAFRENVCKYNGCGTIVDNLAAYTEREIYMQLEYKDTDNRISETINEQCDLGEVPEKYRTISNLKDDEKETIKDVFCEFGAYSASTLGQYINVIIQKDNVINSNGEVELCEIEKLDKNCFSDENNALIDYLF